MKAHVVTVPVDDDFLRDVAPDEAARRRAAYETARRAADERRAREATKRELYQRAKAAGVRGRSTMSKAQLRQAVERQP